MSRVPAADLANIPVRKLRGRQREIKAIARALVWTPAYYGMETKVRYETAEVLYGRGVRITHDGDDYREGRPISRRQRPSDD